MFSPDFFFLFFFFFLSLFLRDDQGASNTRTLVIVRVCIPVDKAPWSRITYATSLIAILPTCCSDAACPERSMCKGFSSLPSSCLVKAKEMRVKLSHLADAHHKPKVQNEKGFQDLEALLNNKSGLQAFRGFLRSEFSEENLKFWLACEDYRGSPSKTKASSIYGQFINPDAPQEVNLDAETREALLKAMDSVGADRFNEAQQRIYSLMAKDSFPRFLRSSQRTEAITAF